MNIIRLVRSQMKRKPEILSLRHYVNDHPYVASSFLSVAIARVLGTTLSGRSKDRPELVESRYYSLTLRGKVRVQELLSHLYVLIPVFDQEKHYRFGEDEREKLLRHGEAWLKD